jgi:hypothetical protein
MPLVDTPLPVAQLITCRALLLGFRLANHATTQLAAIGVTFIAMILSPDGLALP